MLAVAIQFDSAMYVYLSVVQEGPKYRPGTILSFAYY